MIKRNLLADKAVGIALKQLQQSYQFKIPRVKRIQDYRRLYNSKLLPKLRIQFNVPIPIFPGMIDTLQSDLSDEIVIEYENKDPADWKAVEKANAAIKQVSNSTRPEAQWSKKFRQARKEVIFSGRGTLKHIAGNEKGHYYSNLEAVVFEDFFFEPLGGGSLENHIYRGQQNIWRTKKELQDGAGGIYDKEQVKTLTEIEGKEWKKAGIWDTDFDAGNRFKPLDLNPESNNYVGEEMFHLVEWEMKFQGIYWYLVFDAYTGIWIRFEKLTDVISSDYSHWISFASHEDPKNFASKSFADDLYPVADSIITLFNQDLTNRQKRNLNAKAYDKEMFKDVQKLDEAQYRPDALVPVDTKGGTRRIGEGLYAFETPELTGTVDLIDWLSRDTGKNLGVTEMQMGSSQPASKRVGVAYAELSQVSKRIDFMSQPVVDAGNELGLRFFNSLQDYMKKPMAIELIGEHGTEWEVLKRADLDIKKDFEITVTSQGHRDRLNQLKKENRIKALEMIGEVLHDPKMKTRNEVILREVGEFTEHEVALLLDPETDTSKEVQAETSAAIQEIVLRSKKPEINYNADIYFVKTILNFAKSHRNTLSKKQYKIMMEYAEEHQSIAKENMTDEMVREAVRKRAMLASPEETAGGLQPAPISATPVREQVTEQKYGR